MVHCENSFKRVCRSGILSDSCRASNSVVSSCLLKKLCAKVADPTGVPSSLNPSVSSTAMEDPSVFFLIEYLAIVFWTSCASEGLVVLRDGSMLSPLQDVSIRVFCGLTKQPRDLPNFSISLQKNCTS